MAGIGILGGTFDPIHYGHLIIAEEARTEFGLERVIFITAADPPHKKDYTVSDAEDRYAMAVLATVSNPYFECSRIELERQGPSYSVDTVRQMRQRVGQDTDIFFIMGADTVFEIMTWHEPEKLLEMCQLVAATRPGYDLGEMKEQLPAEFWGRITLMETPGVHISATELRSRVSCGRSIKYIVPETVEAYIHAHGMYR